jgi:hypothetical protein
MDYPQQPQTSSKKIFVVVGVIIVILAGLIGSLTHRGDDGESGGEYVAPDSPAFLIYEDKAYLPLDENASNNMLRADVAYFARNNYSEYDPEKQPSVAFHIKKKPAKNGSVLEFRGQYEKVKNEISISVNSLNNGRIITSITDTKTKKDLNTQLPSNTQRNKFIATLPIVTKTYSIEYAMPTDLFTLIIFDGSTAATEEAEKALKLGVGIDDLSKEKYEFFAPNSAR